MSSSPLRQWWRENRGTLPRWVQIVGCASRDFVVDGGLHWSAAIAYYSILSLFPLALAGVSVAAWFIDPQWAIERASQVVGDAMPRVETVQKIISKAVAARGQTGLLSLIVLLWAGSRVFAVLIRALNIAFDVDYPYGFLKRLGVELLMLLSIGVLFIVALLSDLLPPVIGFLFGAIPAGKALALAALGWVVPALMLGAGFFCLYRFVPRRACNWQSALIAALAATILVLGARPIFLTYVGRLATYSQIYGWLAIGIVLLVWAQIVAVVTLFCGELASHIQMMAYDGISGEEVARKHRERSPQSSGRETPRHHGRDRPSA